jgi:hypothetical protein
LITKRRIIIGGYDTAEHGWTLSACKLTKGQQVQNFVSVPGRYAPLDFSTYLTDGQPYYGNAKLDVTLECSEGTRDQRLARIELMANMLDGRTWQILHPDHPGRYLVGRVQVSAPDYNDHAHCAVKLSAICEPWLYNAAETVIRATPPANTTTEISVNLTNSGRLAVTPKLHVTGTITVKNGENSQTLSAGEWVVPWIYIVPAEGFNETATFPLQVNGSGTVEFVYREAVLAV